MNKITDDDQAYLRFEHLSKVYATRDGEVRALNDISLTQRRGEFLSHVGPSGCGKSTLLMIAAGLHPEWPRGLLLDEWREDWGALVRKTGASALHLNADNLTRARIGIVAETRLPILAYTVNNPALAKELLHWGVSAVFTDNPKEIIEAL